MKNTGIKKSSLIVKKTNGKKSYFVLFLFLVLGLFDEKISAENVDIIEKILNGSGITTIFHKFYRIAKNIKNMKNPTLGALSLKEEKLLSKNLNDLIKPFIVQYANNQKFWLKLLIKVLKNKGSVLFLKLIQYLDNNFAEKLGDNFKIALRDLLLAISAKDIDKFKESFVGITNTYVDLPKLDEKNEALIFRWITDGIEIFGNIILKK